MAGMNPCLLTIRTVSAMKLLMVVLTAPLLVQGVLAQIPTGTINRAASGAKGVSVTNNLIGLSSTGKTIEVSGRGAGSVSVNKEGSYTIPEGGGRSTQVRTTSDGGLMIREPGAQSVTTVTRTSDGGLIVRGPDSRPIIVSPEGTVRSFGRKNNSTYVTTSMDGSSVTIWDRDGDGRVYTVPLPEK